MTFLVFKTISSILIFGFWSVSAPLMRTAALTSCSPISMPRLTFGVKGIDGAFGLTDGFVAAFDVNMIAESGNFDVQKPLQ